MDSDGRPWTCDVLTGVCSYISNTSTSVGDLQLLILIPERAVLIIRSIIVMVSTTTVLRMPDVCAIMISVEISNSRVLIVITGTYFAETLSFCCMLRRLLLTIHLPSWILLQ